MECSEPILLYLDLVRLTSVWERKHPKLLDEEMGHRWRALKEEEASKHAVAREWKEERSLNTHTSQRCAIVFWKAIPAGRAVLIDLDLQLLGQTPG